MECRDSRDVHSDSIVIDGLNASVFDRELLERLRKGGLTAVNVTVSILENCKQSILKILEWRRMFRMFQDVIMPINSLTDIRQAKTSGKVGIILGFQNTAAIEEDVELLEAFAQLGIRIIQLTYNERNLVGDGCFERTDEGLTGFGLSVIRKMNDLGLLIDLSHVGPRTTIEAIEASEHPVAITHSNPKSLLDHPRNKTDEQIKLLASRGGVIGATFWPFFLKKGMDATVEDFLDNIDHWVNLVGPDFVGIASDFFLNRSKRELQVLRAGRSQEPETVEFTWPVVYPDGIATPEEFPALTDGLIRRGYSVDDVKKIMGENLMRLFRETWGKAAAC